MSIPSLLSYGYTAFQILKKLAKGNKGAASTIEKLAAYGYTAEHILKKLTGGKGKSYEEYQTPRERAFAAHKHGREAIGRTGKKALVLGASLGGLALRNKGLKKEGSEEREKYREIAESLPSREESSKEEPLDIMPSGSQEKRSFEEDFPQLGRFAEKLMKSGKSPDEVYDTLKKSRFYSPLLREYEEIEGSSYLDRIKNKKGSSKDEEIKQSILNAIRKFKS